LDLRGNAGGLLDAAIDVCDLFIDQGTIVSTRSRDGQVRSSYEARADMVLPPDIPIAVLVNNYSASASEIVAACLQDHQRAVIVGSRTWGKGTVQNLFELEGGSSALKLTTAGYMRPSGKNIHKRQDATDDEDWGVLPSQGFEVSLTDEETEQVFLARRQRDLGSTGADDDAENQGTATTQSTAEDRQLGSAIEYLRQQLGTLQGGNVAA
jgi:carboxyl-terminal processing protease